ncbi:MAG: 2TM domain-containing protein [Hyphomicrobiales bacterium]|nr:2TM domain-containing protein [Hyphomicrobiales bacterium]
MQETEQHLQAGRKALAIHAAVYVVVNAVLAGINLSQTPAAGEARELWFIWPLAGWGIGLGGHALALMLQKRAAAGGLFAEKDVQGVAVHLFVYIAVNALLIAVNVRSTPESLWFQWPLLGWGIGLAGHAFLAYRSVMQRTLARYAAEQRVLAEIQLEKQAAEIAAAVTPTIEEKPEPAPAKRKPARKRATRKKAAPARKRKPARKAGPRKTARKPARKPAKPTRRKPAAKSKQKT